MSELYAAWWPVGAAVPGVVYGLASSRGRHEAGVAGAALGLMVLTATAALSAGKSVPASAVWAGAGLWLLSVLLLGRGRIGEGVVGAAVFALCAGSAAGLGHLRYEGSPGAVMLPIAVSVAAVAASIPAGLVLRWPWVRRLVVAAVVSAFAVPLVGEYGIAREAAFCAAVGAVTALALDLTGAVLIPPGERTRAKDLAAGIAALLTASGLALAFRWQAGYGAALWSVGASAVWLASGDGTNKSVRSLALVGACIGVLRMMFEALGSPGDLADPYGFTGVALGLGLGIPAAAHRGVLGGLGTAVLWAGVAAAAAVFLRVEGLEGLAAGATAAVLVVLILATAEPSSSEPRDPLVPAGLAPAAYIAGTRLLPLVGGLTRAQKAHAATVVGAVGCVLLVAVWAVGAFVRRR